MTPYTSSGASALRMARERPRAPIVGMTPRRASARRLALVWGVNPVLCHDVMDVAEMTEVAVETAAERGFAHCGQTIVIAAGMPFGSAGTTKPAAHRASPVTRLCMAIIEQRCAASRPRSLRARPGGQAAPPPRR